MCQFDSNDHKIETVRRVLAFLKSAHLDGLRTARHDNGGHAPMPLDFKNNAMEKLCPAA